MNNLLPVVYALKDNQLVHVDTVPTGKDCGCYCDACKEPLIAKNRGPLRQHHFAHRHDSDCKSGYQTQLHLLAKEIFLETKELILPEKNYEREPLLEAKLFGSKKIVIKNVQLEKRINNIIPDIVITDENDELYFVEIKVSHEVDPIKAEKIKQLNVSCIEIDLSGYILESKKELKEKLLHHKELYKWIYFKDQDLIQNKMNEATELIDLINVEKVKYPSFCPKKQFKSRKDFNANYETDCQKCPFKLGVSNFENKLVCGGKLKILQYESLRKYKSIKKINEQIVSVLTEMNEVVNFETLKPLNPKPIKELWEGKPMIVRNLINNLEFYIYKDPFLMNAKYNQIYGFMIHKNKSNASNTKVYYFYLPIWIVVN